MTSPLVVQPPSALPSFIESSSMLAPSDPNTSTATSGGPPTDPSISSASAAYIPAASAFYPKTFR